MKILGNADVPFPKSYVVRSRKDIGKIPKLKKMAVKSSEEEKGKKVDYAHSRKELVEKLDVRLKHGPQIVQEYIEGFGCGFFALCDKGKVLQSFQHKRIRQYPESGGVSSVAESFYDKKLEGYGKKLVKKLNWTGVCMVEFICDEKSGKYYFIEFNPKFWGSLDLPISCGVEFPYLLYQLSKGKQIKNRKYDIGKRFRWVLPEDTLRIKTSKKKTRAFMEWVGDFFDGNVKSDVGYLFKDPLPVFIRMGGTVYSLLFRK
jgi:predicted ATP-grasp superfamily ATP-dependent carboligase